MNDKSHPLVKRILSQYLAQNDLAKTACITNCYPTKYDKNGLIQNFSYVCFCVPNYSQKVKTLFLAYLNGYRVVDYDVVVSAIENGLVRRQFGYACLRFETPSKAQEITGYIAANKKDVNRKHPVILRVLCEGYQPLDLPQNVAIRETVTSDDVVFEVT